MLELGVSQAQSQFTKILSQKVLIVDRKSGMKKAVILPYEEYSRLVKGERSSKDEKNPFDRFVGALGPRRPLDDERYRRIVE